MVGPWLIAALGVMALIPGAGLAGDDAPGAGDASWQLGLRSTGYFYKTEDAAGRGQDVSRTFQTFSGTAYNLADGKLLFRGSGRFALDSGYEGPGLADTKLYSGYLQARMGRAWTVRLGRQFLRAGVAGLTLDGARLDWRGSRGWDGNLWVGARAVTATEPRLGDWDRDAAFGVRVSRRLTRGLRVAASAAVRERLGVVAERPVGLDVRSTTVRNLRLLGQGYYDLERKQWARLGLQARWRSAACNPELTFQFLDRRPGIDAVSWFSRFTDLDRIRMVRASLRHTLPSGFGAEAEYMGSFVGERTASRLGLAALIPMGRVGYSVRLGEAGEENRLYGEISHRLAPWLAADAQASLLTYALLQDAPADQERDLISLAGRLRLDLRPGARLILAVQSLENPTYNKDVRVLLGLDLSMARGVSEFGLAPGGWLR